MSMTSLVRLFYILEGIYDALYSLKDDPTIIRKGADKGSVVVAWGREDYLKKAYTQLNDRKVIHFSLNVHSSIEDWDSVIFEQCKTNAKLKEGETLWQHRLKTFYPICLNEKMVYLYWHKKYLALAFQLSRNMIF